MRRGVLGGMAILGLAGLAYWVFWPAKPAARCSDDEVREETRILIGRITSAGKYLDQMLDPAWKPGGSPPPAGSNGYIAPTPKKVEKPDSEQVRGFLKSYVVLVGPSVATNYNRDLDAVTCRVSFRLDADALAEAAKVSEVYRPAATIAATQGLISGFTALAAPNRVPSATYTVQPGDSWGRVLITVEPLAQGAL